MSPREELRNAALLGANIPLPAMGAELDGFASVLTRREHPQRLLDTIAFTRAYEQAGALALPARTPPSPCESDARPVCGTVAAGHLTELLTEQRGLLPEWLALAAEAKQRPPGELLPALLDLATRDRSLRAGAAAAAGPLGTWLAQFRADWEWVRGSNAAADEAIWETGTLPERIATLRSIRAADPARGRALLERTWASEPADAKRQFVDALATGLGSGDEPFLESSLDDRSVVVRRAAAELLGSLPESRFAQRMPERLAGRVRFGKSGLLGRKWTVELSPFESLDAAMIRDGIEKKPPAGSKLGERAWWTAQALASVHPLAWLEQSGAAPKQLLEAAKNSEWADVLLDGWRAAAIRHRAADWLAAFAQAGSAEVFRAMEPCEREQCMLHLLGAADPQPWLARIAALCQHAWSEPFTRSVLQAAAGSLPKEGTGIWHYQLKPLLRSCALLASTECDRIPADDTFAEFAGILHYRRQMRHALQNQEGNG